MGEFLNSKQGPTVLVGRCWRGEGCVLLLSPPPPLRMLREVGFWGDAGDGSGRMAPQTLVQPGWSSGEDAALLAQFLRAGCLESWEFGFAHCRFGCGVRYGEGPLWTIMDCAVIPCPRASAAPPHFTHPSLQPSVFDLCVQRCALGWPAPPLPECGVVSPRLALTRLSHAKLSSWRWASLPAQMRWARGWLVNCGRRPARPGGRWQCRALPCSSVLWAVTMLPRCLSCVLYAMGQ